MLSQFGWNVVFWLSLLVCWSSKQFCMTCAQGREPCRIEFTEKEKEGEKKKINPVGLSLDIYELICSKLVMIGSADLYSWIPMWMTLAFVEGHKIMRKPEVIDFKLPSQSAWYLVCSWNFFFFHTHSYLVLHDCCARETTSLWWLVSWGGKSEMLAWAWIWL